MSAEGEKDRAAERDLFGYVWSELRGFGELPLSDVDSLVLSCLSYLRLPEEVAQARTHEGLPVRELFRAEWLPQMTQGLWNPEGMARLVACVAASPRFRDVRLSDYVDEFDEDAEKQFSACTLRLPTGGDAYVSFRGTDNTLVGWKEDLSMAFAANVPSQRAAVAYLERVAPSVEGRLYAGGHSKGGNLAVYAASMCSDAVAARLARVFSHDGPGFTAETLSDARWEARSHLVSKTVPRSSFVGMFLERQEDFVVVESSATGLGQHDPFSWVVEDGSFVEVERIARGMGYLDESLNQWVASLDRHEREGFVNALFSVLYAGGEDTFAALKGNWQEALPAMMEQLGALEPEERSLVAHALVGFVRALAPDISLPQLPSLDVSALPAALRSILPLSGTLEAERDARRKAEDGGEDRGGVRVGRGNV